MLILKYAVFITKIKLEEISKKSWKKNLKCARAFCCDCHRISRFLVCFKGDIKHRIAYIASFLK